MQRDNKVAVSPSRPFNCWTRFRLRKTFLPFEVVPGVQNFRQIFAPAEAKNRVFYPNLPRFLVVCSFLGEAAFRKGDKQSRFRVSFLSKHSHRAEKYRRNENEYVNAHDNKR